MNAGTAGLSTTGNWREVQKIDEHDVIYVKTKQPMQKEILTLWIIIFGLGILLLIALCGCIIFAVKASKVPSKKESEMKNSSLNAEGG